VRAALHHGPVVDDDDLVGAHHGRQAVGDHDDGAAAHQRPDGLLHGDLGLGVQRRGGLVEQHHRCVLQEGRAHGSRVSLALLT
jgi:hypothetical protein